jgi:hypothetical protein
MDTTKFVNGKVEQVSLCDLPRRKAEHGAEFCSRTPAGMQVCRYVVYTGAWQPRSGTGATGWWVGDTATCHTATICACQVVSTTDWATNNAKMVSDNTYSV